MHKAYDIILQSEVAADLVAQNGDFSEPYRFECSCCGEEVYVAAPFSKRMVAHFRHRCGNNDTECENYLGNHRAYNIDAHSRRSNREKVEFYYENTTKTFNVGIQYSANEISEYERHKSTFEIRANDTSYLLRSLLINTKHFTPDAPTLFPLGLLSYSYYISNTLDGKKRKHVFFKGGNIPTFFKIHGSDDNFKARLVRSETLFTNIKYFVVLQSQYSFPTGGQLPREIQVSETFRFKTMGTEFLGMILSIEKKTAIVDNLLNAWEYKLEASETLTLLWPPATLINDCYVMHSDTAFIYTSFKLQAHGNINVHSTDISGMNCGVSKITVKRKTKVFKKNAEIIIEKQDTHPVAFSAITPIEKAINTFTVSDDGLCFLFNRSGVIPLVNGQAVRLTLKSEIRRYHYGYLTGRFYPPQNEELNGEALLEDILMHCKLTEELDLNVFALIEMSDVASRYIDRCRDSNLINAVVKQHILEGFI